MTLPQIQHYAESLAQQYNPEVLAPFPFEKIQADRRNVEILLSNLGKTERLGMTGYNADADKFVIFVSPRQKVVSQNLMIAHELGHYFLHQTELKKPTVFVDEEILLQGTINEVPPSPTELIYEVEANNFALALLMPRDTVLQVWESLKNVQECAKVFQVPVIAMVMRLEQIGVVI